MEGYIYICVYAYGLKGWDFGAHDGCSDPWKLQLAVPDAIERSIGEIVFSSSMILIFKDEKHHWNQHTSITSTTATRATSATTDKGMDNSCSDDVNTIDKNC
jgi:hypothetical protein